MDILGPLPETERKNKYVLVIGDYFTKWTEVFPMKDMEAQDIGTGFHLPLWHSGANSYRSGSQF